MEYLTEKQNLIQKAVDALFKSHRFDEESSLLALKLGLQGEKRRTKYESIKSSILINYIRCDSFDSYGFVIKKEFQPITAPDASSIKEFFPMYLTKLENEYDTLHSIANSLVAANTQHLAKCLYEKCSCIMDYIKYYRRTIREGILTGYSPEFILLHQTTAENVHDSFEEKELKNWHPGK